MNAKIEEILEKALMIVGGYAFIPNAENVSILSMAAPNHATLMQTNGEVLETNMDDVELDIVNDFWKKNRLLYEEASNA